jgi:hypothetical protein
MKIQDYLAVTEEQREPLSRFEAAVIRREQARAEYNEALRECIRARISNVRLGSVAGVSETAIRMYRKRNNL